MRNALLAFDRLLSDLAIRHCLIGGFAVGVHGLARATKDIDFLVSGKDFRERYAVFETRVGALGGNAHYRRADLEDPIGDVVRVSFMGTLIECITARFAFEEEFLQRAEAIPFGGSSLPVIAATDLVIMKLRAGGPQDLYDIAGILEVSGEHLDFSRIERMAERLHLEEKLETARKLASGLPPRRPAAD